MLMYVNLISKDTNLDVNFLYNFADINILTELKKVDGVGYADILGNREYAMRVWLKPDRMLAYKISADEVLKAIDEQNLEAAPGKTGESSGKQAQAFQYVLKYPGRFNTKEGYENIIIRASEDGQILRIKDVADVEFGSSYYDLYSKMNGRPSAAIMIKQSYGSNASDVIKNVKTRLAEIKESSFPKGMDYELSYDVSKF
jgi:HAE1 family hydrophobic/amphiphilic exporter-1